MNCELLKFRKFLTCKFQLVRLNIMSQFIRPVDKHVEDLLVLDIEAFAISLTSSIIISQIFSVMVSWTLSAITSLKRPPIVS